MSAALARHVSSSRLLARLIAAPDLAPAIRALPPTSFVSLVREIGVEDAGELLALATPEQLVTAFDEDLFRNTAPGERETFDSARFAVWLAVLLEAGDGAAAARFVELSEDFAVQALSSGLVVLDEDALRSRMSEGGDDAEAVDKALESSLSEEIDGYLLVAREHEGWDAVLSLILALDRDHRSYLERILDRCANLSRSLLEDLDALATHLSSTDSLAEDVEAEREARRSALGHVEPRAARSFLALAQQPLAAKAAHVERDPITRAYFRELSRRPMPIKEQPAERPNLAARLGAGSLLADLYVPALPALESSEAMPLVEALQRLEIIDAETFAERVEELWYLANVLLAGAGTREARLRPAEAIEAALATVTLGILLEARARHQTTQQLAEALRGCSADRFFRRASSALGSRQFLRSRSELSLALDGLPATE
jgi:hypothetical protein